MSLWQAALDLIYPRNCVWSGEPVTSCTYHWLGNEALRQIDFIREPYCHRCGYPFFHLGETPGKCPLCADWAPRFDACRSALLYRGPGKAVVQTLKYRNGLYLRKDICCLLGELEDLGEWLDDAVLIPVPLYAARRRERGYNQSEVLARCLARVCPRSSVAALLYRCRATPTQTHLSKEQRRANVRGAFALKNPLIDPGGNYVLIDDVMTTGATLDACAAVLKKAGARRVRAFTLAHD